MLDVDGSGELVLRSRGELVDLLAELERVKAAVEARQLEVLAALVRSTAAGEVSPARGRGSDASGNCSGECSPGDEDRQWVRDEIACVLRVSPTTAAARIRLAIELTTRLPDAFAALRAGDVTLPMARRLGECVAVLDDATAVAVAHRVLPRAARQTFGQFAQAVRRAVLSLDPRGQDERHAAALAERRVTIRPVDDGMAELWAFLPADSAARAWAAVCAVAETAARENSPTPEGSGPPGDERRGDDPHSADPRNADPHSADPRSGDPRSGDQRRADALVALLTNAAGAPFPAGRGPAVHVTVALSTLLRLDDAPGELAGHGPVPAALARRLAADPTGTWRRLVIDPTGRLMDYGRSTYRPPALLAAHVRGRDRTCRFPACNRRAERCDLDHVTPWSDGGATNTENLQAVCPRHHQLKHDDGWRTARTADGSIEWHSPSGRSYLRDPELLPLDTTARHADPPDDPATDDPATDDSAGGADGRDPPDP